MVVYVIGLGSMGKRRIRLLSERENIHIIGIESNPERREEVANQFNIETFDSIEAAEESIKGECAFICTSPLSHAAIINNCLNHKLNVFTEINLIADGYEENIALAKEKGLVLFLSSTFLYRPETNYIIDRVSKSNSPLNYMYHVGQYLPDWHPWEDYNSFFVGNTRTNGCREIFAIELPWIVTCFGEIKDVTVLKSKNTSLKVDYNDNYLVQIQHENGTKGVFAVDVVSRKAVRRFEVYGEDLYLTWNGTPDSLIDYDIDKKEDIKVDVGVGEHKEGYASFITENPYREEITTFLALIQNPANECRWDFERDLGVLNVIDRIEG